MKLVVPIIAMVVGFVGGWAIAHQRVENQIKRAFPEEVKQAVEAAEDLIGSMGEKELAETMEMIQEYAQNVVKEGDLQTLWEALTAKQFSLTLEGSGVEAAHRLADERVERLREKHEGGMELGGWEQLADSLLRSIPRNEDEQDTALEDQGESE